MAKQTICLHYHSSNFINLFGVQRPTEAQSAGYKMREIELCPTVKGLQINIAQSKLLQRRQEVGLKKISLSLKQVDIKETLNPFKLIKQMKEKRKKVIPVIKNKSCKEVDYCKDLDYIFIKADQSKLGKKESRISDFLDEEGIFQINLSVAMKEYNINVE